MNADRISLAPVRAPLFESGAKSKRLRRNVAFPMGFSSKERCDKRQPQHSAHDANGQDPGVDMTDNRNIHGNRSPPEPAVSSVIITLGPWIDATGVFKSAPYRIAQ